MNKIAIDTYYSGSTAHTVGVIFSSWSQKKPTQIIEDTMFGVEESYVPGEFYKRELPCILRLLEKVDLKTIDTILVDGFVWLPGEKKGLGGKLWDEIEEKYPHLKIIGVAKSPYDGCQSCSSPVLRGEASNPLWVNSIGIDQTKAAEIITGMAGKYRLPDLLKVLDKETKKSR